MGGARPSERRAGRTERFGQAVVSCQPRGWRGHCSQRMTGTVEILLKGDPSTTRVLYARYTSVRCARSTRRTTRVSLKMSEVFTLNTSAFLGSFVRSTVI